MSQVHYAPDCLLSKLATSSQAENIKLSTVLWGIWFWRNKRVWEDKLVNADLAMDLSFNSFFEWRKARLKERYVGTVHREGSVKNDHKWCPPPQVGYVFDRMVASDQNGRFIKAKVLTLSCPATVLEAESIGVREALSWVIQRGDDSVIIESDSLLTVRALHGKKSYLLEVGHVIEHCKWLLQSVALGIGVTHIRKQANKVAHSLARIPCSINCFHVFTSPPSQLLETLQNDFSNE
ncbi:uncharacterized protein LOC141719707 [Apium graveolens]|uniref:uncharacterized protein LOC141719707 n=1 Tax=Apium graveolens TaxID=4045 RepID=UPI003D799C9C